MRDSSGDLEQVHVRGMNRRSLRLKLVAGLGMALAMLVLPVAASAQGLLQRVSTQTSLTVTTSDQGGHTQATAEVSVIGADGLPATGAIAITEDGRQLAGMVLDATGQATAALVLPGGMHNLQAVYSGDVLHQNSVSLHTAVHALVSSTPSFQVSLTAVSPSALPLVLNAGNAGTVNVTVTPVNPPPCHRPCL